MKKIALLLAITFANFYSYCQVVTISQPTPGCCWYSGVDDLGGQSFTITQAGVITEIRFNTQGVEGLTTVELREGQNVSGTLLYSTVVNVAAAGWVIVPIPNIPVCEGVYCYTQSGWQWGDQNLSDPYPGGGAYYSGSWIGSIDQVFEIVQVINNEPTSPTVFSNYTVCSGTAVPLTNYTITDESPATVIASATSSNVAVIPNANIILGGAGAARTISFSTPPTTPGTTTITLNLDDGNCSNNYTFIVTVNASPTMTSASNQTICSGFSANIPLSSTLASTFTWIASPNPNVTGESIIAQTTSTINDNLINTSTTTQTVVYTVTPISSIGACIGAPQTVSVIVNPTPNVVDPPDQVVCVDLSTAAIVFTGSVAGTIYTWTNSNPSIGLTVSGVGNIAAFMALNPGFTPVVATVTVTPQANGCVGTNQTMTFTINPSPNVFVVPFPSFCENEIPYTMNEGSPIGPGGVYFGNGVGGGIFDPSIAGPGVHSIEYVYTDLNGCADSASQNITVFATPAVTFSVLPVFCEDAGPHTLIEALPVGGVYSGPGVVGGIFESSVAGPGAHTIAYTYTDGNGCTNVQNQTVVVNALPPVIFSPVADFCGNDLPYTLVEATPAGGIYSGTGVSGGIFDPTLAGIGAHAITYTFTDGGTTCTNFDVQTIVVNDAPTVIASASDVSLCDGETVTLTGSGADSYSWSNGATNGIAFSPSVGTITYIVAGADLNGCQDTDSIEVTVHSLPIVDAGPDQTICEGGMITLNGNGALSYIWDNGVLNNVAFSPPLGNTNYNVIGTDVNSCQNTNDVNVTVNPKPVLTLSPDQIFCLGDTLTLSAAGALAYDWNLGAGSGSSFSISPTATTTVQVAGTSNGCTTYGDIVLTLDDPNLVDAGNDVIICAGFTTTLIASGGISYSWSGPGVVNETAANYGFQVDTTAFYYVTAITANGCSYTDSVFVTASTDPSCTILPLTSFSPNDDAVNDSWKIQGIDAFPNNHVTILNRWGDIVFEKDNYDNSTISWIGTQPNGTDAPEGTYFYIIEITDGPSSTGWIQLLK